MNKKQWNVFAIASYLLGILFAKISLQWKGTCGLEDVNMMNIFSCVRGEIFAPFPYIFFALGLVCFICAWLEPKTKNEISKEK